MKVQNWRSVMLRRYWSLIFVIFLFPLTVNGFAQTVEDLPEDFVNALNKAEIPVEAVGIYIQPLSNSGGSKIGLLEVNDDIPYLSASTMKVVTTYSALEILGPAYRWETEVYSKGRQEGDVLIGDLIFKGSGDPEFDLDSFWYLLRLIRQKGIREIHGNLVLDRSAFAEIDFDSGAFDDDPFRPYNAGPDALLLNRKVLEVIFKPNGLDGTVTVLTSPTLDGIAITPPTLIDTGKCNAWKKQIQLEFTDKEIRFNGNYPLACGEQNWLVYPATMRNSVFFKSVFVSLWKELGGQFYGDVKEGVLPEDAFLLAKWHSPTLSEVVRETNKYSNNIMARHILMTIGRKYSDEPATPEQGIAAIYSFLAEKGISTENLFIENGSGLSRVERISPKTMGNILFNAFHSAVMPELMASFPVVGRDGTLWRSMKYTNVAGKAHIKTGAIQDVRAIAGYVLSSSGERYIVVFMVNHPNAGGYQKARDALLNWIYDKG